MVRIASRRRFQPFGFRTWYGYGHGWSAKLFGTLSNERVRARLISVDRNWCGRSSEWDYSTRASDPKCTHRQVGQVGLQMEASCSIGRTSPSVASFDSFSFVSVRICNANETSSRNMIGTEGNRTRKGFRLSRVAVLETVAVTEHEAVFQFSV